MRSFSLPDRPATALPHNISRDPYLFAKRFDDEKLDEAPGADPQHFYIEDFIKHEESPETSLSVSPQSRVQTPIEEVIRYFSRHHASANPLYQEADFGDRSDHNPTAGELPRRADSCTAAIVPKNTAYWPHAQPPDEHVHMPVLHAMLRRIFFT